MVVRCAGLGLNTFLLSHGCHTSTFTSATTPQHHPIPCAFTTMAGDKDHIAEALEQKAPEKLQEYSIFLNGASRLQEALDSRDEIAYHVDKINESQAKLSSANEADVKAALFTINASRARLKASILEVGALLGLSVTVTVGGIVLTYGSFQACLSCAASALAIHVTITVIGALATILGTISVVLVLAAGFKAVKTLLCSSDSQPQQ